MGKKDRRNNKSLHHIIGKCNRDKFNVDFDDNKVIITQQLHDAFNLVFGRCQSPKEQLQVMIDMWGKTLSQQTKNELYNILSKQDKDFYLRKLVK